MHPLKTLDNIIAKIESIFIACLLSSMVILTFTQVLLRNFFNEGILWADILTRQLVLWVGFLGASLAVRERKHIAIDFLPHFLPKKVSRRVKIWVDVVTTLITTLLTAAAYQFVLLEKEAESTLFLDIPVWIFQTILPFSFAMITFRIIIRIFENMFNAKESQK